MNRPDATDPRAAPDACLNCGARLSGPYCAQCGQKESEWSEYVASSRARDLYEAQEGRLAQAGIRGSTPREGTGEAYLEEFMALVNIVGSVARGEA